MKKETNKELRINISEKHEVEISKKQRIIVTIPKIIGEIRNFVIKVNKYGEKPSIIQEMKKTKEDNEFIEYTTNVKFDMYGNYYFFFSLQVKDENGFENKAIKLNRKTNKPFITEESKEAPYWVVLVIQNNFEVPKWAKDKIFYQIFVDRFYRSEETISSKLQGRNYRNWGDFPSWMRNGNGDFHNNDFFCGNIRGIEEKLEYLKSLNVGVIYLSPINESLYRYERYASTNHMEIDKDAGTFEDLERLHTKARKMGMYLILDIAFNHCSSDNPMFKDALNNPNSKYRNWFYFDKNGNYKFWYGQFRDMPIFNQNNVGFQQYVYGENGVVEKFSKYVDGFRLDVAEELQEFFLEGIRNRANKCEKHIIIGECWNKVNSSILGKSLDSMTNYLFTNAIYKYVVYGEHEYFKWQIEDIINSYPQNTIDTMINSLDTHDIVRALTILGGKCMRKGYDRIWDIDKDPSPWHINTEKGRYFLTDHFRKFEYENDTLEERRYEYAKKLLKISVIIQYFLPGNPCIFYGTEVGLHGYKDPFNRKCFPWDNMDEDLLSFYQEMGNIRKEFKGEDTKIKIIEANEEILKFVRYGNNQSAFVAINRTDEIQKIEIPEEFKEEKKSFFHNATKNVMESYGGIVILN